MWGTGKSWMAWISAVTNSPDFITLHLLSHGNSQSHWVRFEVRIGSYNLSKIIWGKRRTGIPHSFNHQQRQWMKLMIQIIQQTDLRQNVASLCILIIRHVQTVSVRDCVTTVFAHLVLSLVLFKGGKTLLDIRSWIDCTVSTVLGSMCVLIFLAASLAFHVSGRGSFFYISILMYVGHPGFMLWTDS